MRQKALWAVAIGAVLLVSGILLAGNMGFKLIHTFPGGGLDGTFTISLPFFHKDGLDNASDLLDDVPNAAGVSFHNRFNNLGVRYTGVAGTAPDFALLTGVGYVVTVTAASQYTVTGSHNPEAECDFFAGGLDGTNFFACPYHAVPETAENLLNDIPNSVGVGFFNKNNNLGVRYTGVAGTAPDFDLTTGQSFYVTVTADSLSYIPPHY